MKTKRNNKKSRDSNTEGNYKTLLFLLECIENCLNQVEERLRWSIEWNHIPKIAPLQICIWPMVIPYKFGSLNKSAHSKLFAGKSLLHKSPL